MSKAERKIVLDHHQSKSHQSKPLQGEDRKGDIKGKRASSHVLPICFTQRVRALDFCCDASNRQISHHHSSTISSFQSNLGMCLYKLGKQRSDDFQPDERDINKESKM